VVLLIEDEGRMVDAGEEGLDELRILELFRKLWNKDVV
jgi:hypothetical protein